jgi:cysteine-rich repeat protein
MPARRWFRMLLLVATLTGAAPASATLCGDGFVNPGEQCDDGNLEDDDCCSSICMLTPAGLACVDDNPCTDDRCNAFGQCVYINNAATCTIPTACPPEGHCNNGRCEAMPEPSCPLCERCVPPLGCIGRPADACTSDLAVAGRARLQITNSSPDDGDRVSWRVDGTATLDEFGDPVDSTDYAFCLYATPDGAAPPTIIARAGGRRGLCAGKPCWLRAPHGRGFTYADKERLPTGLAKLILRPVASASSKLVVKGRGANLGLSSRSPLPLPVVAQLQASNGSCWEVAYGSGDVQKNDGRHLKARK